MIIKKLHKNARLPERGTEFSAGLDLRYLGDEFTLYPGERHCFGTGLACALPYGYYGQIAPRSGLAVRYGIDTLAGVIDGDYRGEIGVVLINHGGAPWHVISGERIAQMIIKPYSAPAVKEVLELPPSGRGTGGFGSTGQ